MKLKRLLAAGIGILALAGCLETAGLGNGSGAPAAAPGAVGDGAFVRDEEGCLYEVIAGARVPIVGPDGKQDCGRTT